MSFLRGVFLVFWFRGSGFKPVGEFEGSLSA